MKAHNETPVPAEDTQPAAAATEQPAASKPKYDLTANSSTPYVAPLKSSEYASSHDDQFGVQKNWFTALYKQLNYFAKTGAVEGLKGRQRQVFEAVEKEFEQLYDKYLKTSGLSEGEHRATLMVLLSLATYRVLNDEITDPALVRDVIRTNQGSMMMAILLPLHRARLWVLRNLLAEDPYKQAVNFLPALQEDMGSLCQSSIQVGPKNPEDRGEGSAPAVPGAASSKAAAAQGAQASEVSLVISKCKYHEILNREDAPFLLSEFCCHHGLVWLNEFKKYGVEVNLDSCMTWDDECCRIRIAKPQLR